MTIVVFSDIDDTLMQTKRKCPSNESLQVGAVDKNGLALSFTTQQQNHLLTLFKHCELIPVTGRNKDALDRVSMDFIGYKIIDHGAIILNENNHIVPDWLDILNVECEKWHDLLEKYNQNINEIIQQNNLELRCKVISDYGFSCYISIKGNSNDFPQLNSLASTFCCLADNARLHINGNNMALLPPYACKKQAVDFLKTNYIIEDDSTLFIAAGDSCTDLPYMSSCHFKIIPSSSQIANEKL